MKVDWHPGQFIISLLFKKEFFPGQREQPKFLVFGNLTLIYLYTVYLAKNRVFYQEPANENRVFYKEPAPENRVSCIKPAPENRVFYKESAAENHVSYKGSELHCDMDFPLLHPINRHNCMYVGM